MNEANIAWGLLGIFGTLAGVGGLIWSVAAWSIRNRQEHAKILETLQHIMRVTEQLDDVLNHPNDTKFSVEPLRKELADIRQELRRLRAE